MFKPIYDRVLVKRIDTKTKSTGGIIIPDTVGDKPNEGVVMAVGTGRILENGNTVPPQVKAGDRVVFGKWSGTEIKQDGETLLVMKETDILGTM